MAETQRSDLEMLISLSRALARPAPLNERFAASVLRQLGAADRDLSLWSLGRGQGIPFADAMGTVSQLVEAGLVQHSKGRMPDCVQLTEAGRSLVEGLGLAKSRAAAAGPAPGALFAAARSLDTAPAAAVPDESCRRVMNALLEYSDQPVSRIAKRTGLGLLEVCSVMRALTGADLAVLQRSSSDDRARLTADGRRLALRLAGRGSSLPGVA